MCVVPGMPQRKPKKGAKQRKGPKQKEQREPDYEGFKFLKKIEALLAGLRDESNPNRVLHFDYYVTWLLFFYFNPTLKSLRGLQAATGFAKVRKRLKLPRASLGSLSEAQHVFDYEALKPIMEGLLEQLPADKGPPALRELKKTVTVADGTLLKTLPRVAWALWMNDGKRAAKAHVQFEVMKGGPSALEVTDANTDEKAVFKRQLQPDRIYVVDSGYAKLQLFQDVIDVGSNLVCRLPACWRYELVEERDLTAADREARVLRDSVVRLGSGRNAKILKQNVRLIEIERVDEPSKRMRRERAVRETIVCIDPIGT